MTIPEPFSTKTFSFPGIRANTWRCKHPLHRATGGALLALLLLLVLVFAIPSPANATQATRGDNSWYVGPGGDFQTIQEAVDVAGEGDLIVIANGSYPENVVSGKYLRLKGNSSEDTILSGNPVDSENHSILSGPFQLENLTVAAEGYQSHRKIGRASCRERV